MQRFYKITDGKILSVAGNDLNRQWTDSLGDSRSFYYNWTVPSFDIYYQTKFFFGGTDETGAYMSMGIGIRYVKYIFHLGSVDDFYEESGDVPPDLSSKDEYSENLTVIPLILRVGARGNMEGFFPDFSFGLGY